MEYWAIEDAYLRSDFSTVERLVESALAHSDELPPKDLPYIRLIKARCLEKGCFSTGINLFSAYMEYVALQPHSDLFGSDPLVSAARCLRALDKRKYASQIVKSSIDAIRLDESPEAMLLMGDCLDDVYRKHLWAQRLFRRALRNGNVFGMRLMARSFNREGRYLRGFLTHCAATIVSLAVQLTSGRQLPFGPKLIPN